MRNTEYRPLTLRGYEMEREGVSPETIQEYEQARLAVQSAEGMASLITRHPDAARPEVQRAIGEVMAADPGRFVSIAETASPGDAYEVAYANAIAQGRPAPTAGAGAPGSVRPGIDPERLRQIQGAGGRSVDWHQAQQALRGFVQHQDLDVDPRR